MAAAGPCCARSSSRASRSSTSPVAGPGRALPGASVLAERCGQQPSLQTLACSTEGSRVGSVRPQSHVHIARAGTAILRAHGQLPRPPLRARGHRLPSREPGGRMASTRCCSTSRGSFIRGSKGPTRTLRHGRPLRCWLTPSCGSGRSPSASGRARPTQGIDISGLGAVEGQRSPGPVPQWEGAGTDAMRFVRRHVTLPGTGNRPLLNGVEVDVLAHGNAVEAGFTNTYDLLLAHRAELLSSDGPLARFARDEVRAILRPTRIYTKGAGGELSPRPAARGARPGAVPGPALGGHRGQPASRARDPASARIWTTSTSPASRHVQGRAISGAARRNGRPTSSRSRHWRASAVAWKRCPARIATRSAGSLPRRSLRCQPQGTTRTARPVESLSPRPMQMPGVSWRRPG